MRFESRGPSEFATESALTEIAWEDAVQGLSRAMSTVASEKKQGIVVYQQRVWQRVTTLRVVSSLVFRGHDLLKISNLSPARSETFAMENN